MEEIMPRRKNITSGNSAQKKGKFKTGCGCLTAILIAGAIGGAFLPHDQDDTSSDVQLPDYRIIDRRIQDIPGNTHVTLDVLVSGTITEEGLRELLNRLYKDADAIRSFEYGDGNPHHIYIYLYTSKAHYESGMGQWIAMLHRTGRNAKVENVIQTDVIAHLSDPPEEKFGLSESERREVFSAIVTAEDRADQEVQRQYPIPDPSRPGYSSKRAGQQVRKQAELLPELVEKYTAEVGKKYGLTEEQLKEIGIEGAIKNWPLPFPPKNN